MKKALFLLVAIALTGIATAGNGFGVHYTKQSKGNAQIDFQLGKYAIKNIEKDGQQYATIVFDGKITSMKKGWASLPFISSAIQLSADKNIDIAVANSEYVDITLKHPLLPSRGVIYRNQDPTTIPYTIDPASVQDAWYPGHVAAADQPFIFRDVRGSSIKVYPFQYNAKKNVLRVYTKVNVQVKENETPAINPLTKQATQITREANSWYHNLFINYEESKDLTMANVGDIHVIYTARDADAIQPYITWKKEKGFNVTSEEVATGTNVKTNVQTAYDNNNNLLYVQLVGDWEDIKCELGGGANAPLDPMLGCVVGSDSYPDIAIGRFSGKNANDITIQVNKAISYEKTPDNEGTWYKSAMNIASSEGPGDDGEMDKAHVEIIYNNKLDPFTYDNLVPVYDPGANAGMVSTGVNNGVSIINYIGHGSETTFVTSGFSNNDVNTLTNNNKLPFIISVACVNGKFHMSGGDCFAEAWLKKENGGAVMTLMATINQPWQPPMRGQDYMNDLIIGGYNYDENPGSGTNTTEGRSILGSIVVNSLVMMYAESSGSSDLNTISTWTTFGDCALEARTDTPKALSLSNETILVGSDFTTIVTAGGAPVKDAMVCLSQGNTYISGITNAAGEVTLANTLTPGPAKMVVTAYNTQTIYNEVTVISPSGPYLLVDKVDINNAENAAQYNSTFSTKIVIKNVGNDPANNVTLKLTPQASEYVKLVGSDEIAVGNIAANASVTLETAYSFEAARYVPDATSIDLNFDMTTPAKGAWASKKTLKINAPALALEFVKVNDDAANGNGRLDVGETALLVFKVKNEGHAASLAGKARIASPSSNITINTNEKPLEIIDAEGNKEIAFEISVAADATVGSQAFFSVDAIADKYNATTATALGIGLIMEDFETGDFSAFPWAFEGDQEWKTTNTAPYEGTYSAQSKDITHNQKSTIKINANNSSPQTISFYYKVSSEKNYDFLKFYIDDTEQDKWSGTIPWTQQTYTLEAGNHVLKWEYSKDNMIDSGEDCAWLDNIIMPAVGSNLFAHFTADKQIVCKNEAITYNALAAGATTYEWTFEGGTPASSTEANPVVKYNGQGSYKVTLKVSDGTNESTIVKENFVTVENCLEGIEDVVAETSFSIYPNPNNGQFVLDVNTVSNIQIYNSMGALVYQGKLQQGSNNIDLSNKATGVYIVRILTADKAISKKIIIK